MEMQIHPDVMNTTLRFRLTAQHVSGRSEFFTGNYILRHPLHSGIIFDPQATILTLTLTLDLLNPKLIGFCRLSRTTTVPGFKSFRSGVFVLSC